MKRNLAIIVNSCDEYKILWKPYFKLFKEHWGDCPYQVYLFSQNPDTSLFQGLSPLKREGEWWSDAYKKALEQIPEDYFIWQDESGMLTKDVYTEQIDDMYDILTEEKLTGIHLNGKDRWHFKPDFVKSRKYEYLVTMVSHPYCLSLQPGMWDKRKFMSYMKEKETIWETEVYGSKRASADADIASQRTRTIMPVLDVTEDGRITKEGSMLLKENGFNIKEGHLLKNIIKFPKL